MRGPYLACEIMCGRQELVQQTEKEGSYLYLAIPSVRHDVLRTVLENCHAYRAGFAAAASFSSAAPLSIRARGLKFDTVISLCLLYESGAM